MQVEYVNPFIIGAIEVFEQIASIELKKQSIALKDDSRPTHEIAIVIGVSGYLEGQVIYSFKEHTAERIVSSMMPNSPPEKQKEYMESAIGSLANMITGRATILLAGKQQVLRITPPAIIIGENMDYKFVTNKTLSVSFTSRFGTTEINVALTVAGK